ncbi:hypothetical protein DRH14_03110 [Candidatus Shapirobacteria bacterium]|nr:MAG: hypothetical protein DRH14_03110 [Candidatus Shapirobacteria bacterium]
MVRKVLPKRLQSKLWSKSLANVDLDRDETMVVHRVLAYGDLKDIGWLIRIYGKDRLRRVFVAQPMNLYTKPALNFAKNIILDLDDVQIKEKDYVKTLY